MSTGGKMANQHRVPQEPTLTEKSNGLDYISATIEGDSDGMGKREKVTKNDSSKSAE